MEAKCENPFEVDFKSPNKSPPPAHLSQHLLSPTHENPGRDETRMNDAAKLHEELLFKKKERLSIDNLRAKEMAERSQAKSTEELAEREKEYKESLSKGESNREKSINERKEKAAADVAHAKEVANRVKEEKKRAGITTSP
eukprot:gene3704-4266_t